MAEKKFQRGYLFPFLKEKKTSTERRFTAPMIRIRRKYEKKHIAWKVSDTPLEKYAEPFPQEFSGYLNDRLADSRKSMIRHRLLDVGVGTGNQWINFLNKNPDMEFNGTALAKTMLHPEIKQKIKITTAANLHNHFEPNTFDTIVSHYGTHGQELEALEDIIYLLKPGGEAVVTGISHNLFEKKLLLNAKKVNENVFDIIHHEKKFDKKKSEASWCYHIRKAL